MRTGRGEPSATVISRSDWVIAEVRGRHMTDWTKQTVQQPCMSHSWLFLFFLLRNNNWRVQHRLGTFLAIRRWVQLILSSYSDGWRSRRRMNRATDGGSSLTFSPGICALTGWSGFGFPSFWRLATLLGRAICWLGFTVSCPRPTRSVSSPWTCRWEMDAYGQAGWNPHDKRVASSHHKQHQVQQSEKEALQKFCASVVAAGQRHRWQDVGGARSSSRGE